MQQDILKAVKIMQQGGIIVYPTDTIWGIGCDATNEKAIEKIHKIKKRETSKSMLILLDSTNKLEQYVENIPDITWIVLDKYKNTPITIIYPKAKNIVQSLIAKDGSIGIRITNESVSNHLIKELGKPVVSTSANISGQKYPNNFYDIDKSILNAVDFVLKPTSLIIEKFSPSKIIQVMDTNEFCLIRE